MASGDAYDEQLPELHRADGATSNEIFWALAQQDIHEACDLFRPVWDGGDGARRLRLARGRSRGWPTTRSRPSSEAMRLHERGRPPEPAGQDPRDQAGPARRSRTCIAKGQLDQRHADLLAAALRGGRRVLRPRARAARRRGRRPVEGRLGRELLRLAHRHRGRPPPRRGRRPRRAQGQARGRQRASSPTAHYKQLFSGERWEYLATRARRPSACCGPRPRRRTPTTRTSMYVEELIGPDTVDTMPEETIVDYQDHGQPEPRLELGPRRRPPRARRARRRPASTTTTSPTRSSARASRNSPTPSTS